MTAIIKKELRTYFTSMTGYVFLSFLVLITAIFFTMINLFQALPDYNIVLSNTTIIFLIIIPMLTMRLFAEERKQKTDQLLFTSPLKAWQIVAGKYVAALMLFLIGLGITVLFPLSIARFGELPVPQITGTFIGYMLLGACLIGIGTLVSVLAENQVVAAVVTFAILFVLYILSAFADTMPADKLSSATFAGLIVLIAAYLVYDGTKSLLSGVVAAAAGFAVAAALYAATPAFFDGLIGKALKWFTIMSRFDNFYKGVLSVADIVYYVSFSVAFIVLTVAAIEKRRWR